MPLTRRAWCWWGVCRRGVPLRAPLRRARCPGRRHSRGEEGGTTDYTDCADFLCWSFSWRTWRLSLCSWRYRTQIAQIGADVRRWANFCRGARRAPRFHPPMHTEGAMPGCSVPGSAKPTDATTKRPHDDPTKPQITQIAQICRGDRLVALDSSTDTH